MKSKEVEERKMGGETCPSRPVDSSRIDLYEKDAICVQLASNNILGISYEANTTIFIGCLLQKLVVIWFNEQSCEQKAVWHINQEDK